MLFLVLVLLALGLSLFFNYDVFGPTKLYLAYILAFFADMYLSPQGTGVTLAFIGFILVGLLFSFFEGISPSESRTNASVAWNSVKPLTADQLKRAFCVVWILSLIPIGMMVWIVFLKGGLQDFINTIGLRVLAWRGLGPLLVFVGWYPILNLVYFGLLLQPAVSRWHYLGFFIHFCLLIGMGLLMGSRGILNSFILMLLVVNYLRKRISFSTAGMVGLSLLVVALLLGTMRSGIKWTDDGLRTGFDTRPDTFETGSLNGGILPLQLVYSRDPFHLQYGLTFLTAITNLIPRDLWPEKPDTGGVVLTNDYMAYAWGGASNLSTGIIAEGVINFGHFWGTLFGLILLGFFLLFLLRVYRRLREGADFFDVFFYGSFLLAVAGLVVGEFTNMIVSTFMMKWIPIVLIRFMVMKKSEG